MAELVLDRVTKRYDGDVVAVDDVSLTIAGGEFMALVGPSGCGKSTLLRMIAGLESVTAGRILIDGRDVTKSPPRDRDIAMVFQNYALYPHMSVRQNLGYSLKVHGESKREIAARVDRVARMLGLEDLLGRRPSALSGGQRQRVAMGRAIIREPKAFLMDEPLSNLDAKLRVSMRAQLANLHGRLGTTTVYVTHDQVEAMTLGQRAAVLRDGRIQQVAAPQTLYRDPANLFVAAFIGSPAMNLVDARIDGGELVFGSYRLALPTEFRPGLEQSLVLGIRPESLQDAAFAEPALPRLEVEVAVVEELGSDTHVIFTIDAPPVDHAQVRDSRESEDDELLNEGRAVFTARVDPRSNAAPGKKLVIALDPAGFYFFDPQSGVNLAPPSSPAQSKHRRRPLRIAGSNAH